MKRRIVAALAPAFLLAFAPACGPGPMPVDCEVEPCEQEPEPEPEPCDLEPGLALGDPIEAAPDTWSWVDFPGTRCMDGSETGLAVSLAPEPEGALIYLQGGGLCFDGITCNGVANPNGFSRDDFDAMVAAGHHRIGIFDREDTENPFRAYHWVFIPYCSGDLFGGQNDAGFGGRVYAGWTNMAAFLSRLVPTLSDAPHVVLAGSSAGGYGATLNYDRAQQAFTCTPVHLLNDGGPTFSDTYTRPCLQQRLRDAFALDGALPEDCDGCFGEDGGGLVELLPYLAEKHEDRRLALLTHIDDDVIRFFMGYGYSDECDSPFPVMPAGDFAAGVIELRDVITAPYGDAAFFIQNASGHTFLGRRPAAVEAGGTTLSAWLDAMLNDRDWSTVGP